MKRFNVTGLCVPHEDYMVDISAKIEKIAAMVDDGQYFTINRARQYGKTTTLYLLKRKLLDRYAVASLSFEGVGELMFETEERFCPAFKKILSLGLERSDFDSAELSQWNSYEIRDFGELSAAVTRLCSRNKVVLLIDEVDKSSNNRVFLQFLGMLRDKYLLRKSEDDFTFQSVVLAGVHDIKNIKQKLKREGKYTPSGDEGGYNSPWNIAEKFLLDMSFSADEICGMLQEYETDHETGMDIEAISQEIYAFTSGYPFLVSSICKSIDEELNKDWTVPGVQNAVDILLHEQNTLFDDLFKNLENDSDLYDLVYRVLIQGETLHYSGDNPVIGFGLMYGIVKEANRKVSISNKIFEIRICNYFISKDETGERKNKRITGVLKEDVAADGRFDMELCLRKFAAHYRELFTERDAEFLERHGRLMFLSYLKPLINGEGFYHIESGLTDLRRMDIAVDYGKQQFIIELKIWHGDVSHDKAYAQLAGYMEKKGVDEGYLLTFDLRKSANRAPGEEWVDLGGGARILDIML